MIYLAVAGDNMAKGLNASKRYGREWWGKRPLSGTTVASGKMKVWKRLLHKRERKAAKIELKNLK